jgi:hypothetical protein
MRTLPTEQEYEEMDNLRFPFLLNKESLKKEKKHQEKLKKRIRKLIMENKERFYDPILKKEILPICR